jgi:branched-subunit amino acid transport protein
MTGVWVVVLVVGVVTMAFKAAGPVFVGDRELPPRVREVVELLAPVMLTALVVGQTFGADQAVTVDERVPGVAAGALAALRGVPIVVAMIIGAVVTAALRQL